MRLAIHVLFALLIPSLVSRADEPRRYDLPRDRDEAIGGRVERADARTGIVEATTVDEDGRNDALRRVVEGRYVAMGLARPRTLADAIFFAAEVTEVLPKGRFRVRIAPEAVARFENVSTIVLFRPPGSTTAEMRDAPRVATVVDKSKEIPGLEVEDFSKLEQSRNNLKLIGLAFHNYHDARNRFPPRVLIGPDGKPWHSWRVLILPYLYGHEKLYSHYRLDEPWDGPNNKKLVAEMPDVYHDPVHGAARKDGLTHYAAAAGENVALVDARFNGRIDAAFGARTTAFRDVLDGASNTLLVGGVSPDAKIPWTKPEDVSFDEDFPGIGRKGGFAAPYEADAGKAGLFLRCDGSVSTITTKIDEGLLRNLLVRNDGQVVTPAPSLDPPRPSRRTRPVLEIHESSEGDVAHLLYVEDGSRVPRVRSGAGSAEGSADDGGKGDE